MRRVWPIHPLPRASAGAAQRWRWAHLISAPHRLGFAAGAAMLAATALWWAAALVARHAALPLPWALSPSGAHGLVMALGFIPFFIAGFAFTAGPRWLDAAPVAAAALRAPVVLMLIGWGLALLGFHAGTALAATGVAAVALGWSLIVRRFVRLLRAGPAHDKLHPTLLACTAAIGALSLWAASAALALQDDTALRAATQLALWGFLAPLVATVAHRMLPFFTTGAVPGLTAWRPDALLWAMLAALAAELGFGLAELWWWPLPAAVRWAQVTIELPTALLLLWLAGRWGLWHSLRNRLLAMLHVGFLWLGLAFALAAVSHALMAAQGPAHSLGLAPLHALTMGFLASTLLAMATRVAAGHSGRPVAADAAAWALFWALQAAVLLRLASAMWPAAATPLLLAAVAAWVVATVGWALRYGRWLGRPRADGRPG